jgi:hypothetical protein
MAQGAGTCFFILGYAGTLCRNIIQSGNEINLIPGPISRHTVTPTQ